jgi:hypothetical protein
VFFRSVGHGIVKGSNAFVEREKRDVLLLKLIPALPEEGRWWFGRLHHIILGRLPINM